MKSSFTRKKNKLMIKGNKYNSLKFNNIHFYNYKLKILWSLNGSGAKAAFIFQMVCPPGY